MYFPPLYLFLCVGLDHEMLEGFCSRHVLLPVRRPATFQLWPSPPKSISPFLSLSLFNCALYLYPPVSSF